MARVRRCRPLLGTFVAIEAEDARIRRGGAPRPGGPGLSSDRPGRDLDELPRSGERALAPERRRARTAPRGGSVDPAGPRRGRAPRRRERRRPRRGGGSGAGAPRPPARAPRARTLGRPRKLPGHPAPRGRPGELRAASPARSRRHRQGLRRGPRRGGARGRRGGEGRDRRRRGPALPGRAAAPHAAAEPPRALGWAAWRWTSTAPAVATSAGYFATRWRRGRRIAPLLDPRSGKPLRGRASVTVFAPTALRADALTKVVAFAAPERWQPLLRAEGASAVLLQG